MLDISIIAINNPIEFLFPASGLYLEVRSSIPLLVALVMQESLSRALGVMICQSKNMLTDWYASRRRLCMLCDYSDLRG